MREAERRGAERRVDNWRKEKRREGEEDLESVFDGNLQITMFIQYVHGCSCVSRKGSSGS